jgi:N-acetylmuramoyl-L-alanine amidase
VARHKGGHTSVGYEQATGMAPKAWRLVVVLSCVVAVGAMVYGPRGRRLPAGLAPGTASSPGPSVALPATLAPSGGPAVDAPTSAGSAAAPSAVPLASVVPSPGVPHIGVVAGHWGSDTGATCPDGLTEVEINLDVAQRVVYILQALGYHAGLLAEFDPRLEGYQADAIVSIHADSCVEYPHATPPASGFKVARVEDSLVPEAEDRLVACLAQCYAARTGMYFHANSITYDMTRYHTFYEIDGRTPGAIIEIGFMLNDRHLLTQRADLVAQGIVDGIVCFIEGGGP